MRSGIGSCLVALLLFSACVEEAPAAPFPGDGDGPVGDGDGDGDGDTQSGDGDGDGDTQSGDGDGDGDGDNPGGSDPKIPEISGECPEFKAGTSTVTVGGLGGILMDVGAKGNGDGALVFYWHGTGSSSREYSGGFIGGLPSSVIQDIKSKGGIIVSFNGSTGEGTDCSGTRTFAPGDFKIADQIVACAVRNHNINPRRIYTTGCSAGGLQAGCMASQRSSYIAAAWPDSGGSVFPQMIQDRNHIPALMTMHGGSSDRVIVSFKDTSATINKQFAEAGGFVINCDHGGGHCAAPRELREAAWEFAKAHPFGVDPLPYSMVPSSFPNYCKITSSSVPAQSSSR